MDRGRPKNGEMTQAPGDEHMPKSYHFYALGHDDLISMGML